MNPNNLALLKTLYPDPRIREDAISAWTECEAAMPANIQLVIEQVGRSMEESDALYTKDRDKNGVVVDKSKVVTNAPGGSSYHNYFMAFDFHMVTNGQTDYSIGPNWMKVVAIMKKHGWTWGGDFTTIKDGPHFEKSLGHHWRDLRALYRAGKFIPGTKYVQI